MTDEQPSTAEQRAAASVSLPQPASGSDAPKRLTKQQLLERMRLNFDGLVEEIHALAVRQNQAEDQRESRLDAKAQGLLATAGLSLTVAFTFGGLVLQHPEYIAPLGDALSWSVLGVYGLALLFGLLASIWAVRALKVSNRYKTFSDDDVFNEVELKRIERDAKDSDTAQTFYRRFITVQHWWFWRQHFDIHEEKAQTIKRGQLLFTIFLGILLLIGIAMAASSFVRYENRNDSTNCEPAKTMTNQDTAAATSQSTPVPATPTTPAQPAPSVQPAAPVPTTMPGDGDSVKRGYGK